MNDLQSLFCFQKTTVNWLERSLLRKILYKAFIRSVQVGPLGLWMQAVVQKTKKASLSLFSLSLSVRLFQG